MKYYFICLLALTIPLSVTGQNTDWEKASDLISINTDEAISLADSLLRGIDREDSSLLIKNATAFGRSLSNARKGTEAIKWFQKVNDFTDPEESSSPAIFADFTMNFGRTHAMNGAYRNAIEWYERSFHIVEQYSLSDPPAFYLSRSLGYLYFNLDHYQEAIDHHKKSLEYAIAKNGKEHVDVADAYNNIGLIYPHLNEPGLAMLYYSQAIEILEKVAPDDINLASLYNNSGLVRMDQQRYDEALVLMLKADEYHVSKGKPTGQWCSATNNLGLLMHKMGNQEKAIQILNKAIELKKIVYGIDHPAIAITYSNLGNAHLALGKIDSAEFYFNRSFENNSSKYGKESENVAKDRLNLMRVLHAKGDLQAAETQGTLAISSILGKDIRDVPNITEIRAHYKLFIQLFSEKGKLKFTKYRKQKSLSLLKEAFSWFFLAQKTITKQQNEFVDRESKIFLSEKSSEIIESFLSISFDLFELTNDITFAHSAFEAIENEKSFLLLSNLKNAKNQQWLSIPDSILEERQQIDIVLKRYNERLYTAQLKQDTAQIKHVNSQIFDVTQKKEKIKQEITKIIPAYSAFSTGNLMDIAYVKASLIPHKGQLLSFWEGPDNIFGIGVSKNGFKLCKVPKKEVLVQKKLLSESIQHSTIQSFRTSSLKLYRSIIQPLIEEGTETLIILPSIELSTIPVELLISDNTQNNSFRKLPYLLNEYMISYHYSVGVMKLNKDKDQNVSKSFIGFAPGFSQESSTLLATRSATDSVLLAELVALPYANEEVMTIAELFDGTSITANEASEFSFKTSAKNAGIIHIASHVLIDETDPLLSRIVFSQSENKEDEDGLLHIYELLSMELGADLVTLSACNTGIGKGYAGEGVMSVARGFMYAGVPNVMMSLWSVPDRSTSEIMQSFYTYLKDGHEKAQALRLAKLDYLQKADDNIAAPYYWAGFVFLGNENNDHSNLSWLFVLVAIVSMIGFCIYRIRKK